MSRWIGRLFQCGDVLLRQELPDAQGVVSRYIVVSSRALQPFWLIIWVCGKNLLSTMPLKSNNVISLSGSFWGAWKHLIIAVVSRSTPTQSGSTVLWSQLSKTLGNKKYFYSKNSRIRIYYKKVAMIHFSSEITSYTKNKKRPIHFYSKIGHMSSEVCLKSNGTCVKNTLF